MKKLLLQIEDIKSQIEKLEPISTENQKKLWEKFRLEWNYNSNHIEGNTLTIAQTKALLHFGDDYKVENNSVREVNEMLGHDLAIVHIQKLIEDKKRALSINDICELNQTILVKPFYTDAISHSGLPTRKRIVPGKFKSEPNHVRLPSGDIFKYAEVHEVEPKMNDLINWYRNEDDLDAISKAALFHYKFVRIHPFDDGNGRVSRLLMNYHFMKNGYPPVVIKSEDKKNYLYALQQADLGNIDEFVKYIGQQLLWSLDITMKAAKGEDIEEDGDLDKRTDLLKKKLGIANSELTKRSNKIAYKLLKSSLKELAQTIKLQLTRISELFESTKLSTYINGYGDDNKMGPALLPPKNLKPDEEIIKFILAIDLKSLLSKKGKPKIGHVHKKIAINLDLYNYVIPLSKNRKIEKKYDESLSIHEMNIIAEDVKRSILNGIEQHI